MMDLTFRKFADMGRYADDHLLVDDLKKVQRKHGTRSVKKPDQRTLNQRLLRTMREEGFDHEIIRYSIGFDSLEKNWDRRLDDFEKGKIRLTRRRMKIIDNRSEILTRRNREHNHTLISNLDLRLLLLNSWNQWDNLSADLQDLISRRVRNRLIAMGQSGRHKLYNNDVRAAIDWEKGQFQLFQKYRSEATANRFLIQYPEKLSTPEAEKAVIAIRDQIFQTYQKGGILSETLAKTLVGSVIRPILDQKKAERISRLLEQVTENRLIQFSLEHIDRQYPLKGLSISALVEKIRSAIESEYRHRDELTPDDLDTIMETHIRSYLQSIQDTLAENQHHYAEHQQKKLMENDFRNNIATILKNHCQNFFEDDCGKDYFDQLVRNFVEDAGSYSFHTQNQLSVLVPLATGCYLVAVPDQVPGAKNINRHYLEQMVKDIYANFDHYNRNPDRRAEAPLLDTVDLIQQAVKLAGKLAQARHINVSNVLEDLNQKLVGQVSLLRDSQQMF
jgi:hypothetical protein